MDAVPLSKTIYEKCKALGVNEIVLNWTGGSDEGYLNVHLNFAEGRGPDEFNLVQQIEDWAYNAYEYSGCGDGTDYGDDVTYDLVNNKVTTQSWYHKPEYEPEEQNELEIDNG